jgi:hypothetical protein
MGKKMTFGFRNINGVAMDIKMLTTPNGSWPSARTSNNLANFVVGRMNYYGQRAQKLTQSRGWTPVKTGKMKKSIKWIDARVGATTGRILTGALSVNVVYGRYQELHNPRKPYFLLRAVADVFPKYVASLRRKNILEAIMFDRKQGAEGNVKASRNFKGNDRDIDEEDL